MYVQNAFGLVEFYWSETKLFGPKHGTISLQILLFEPCPESCFQSKNKVDYFEVPNTQADQNKQAG